MCAARRFCVVAAVALTVTAAAPRARADDLAAAQQHLDAGVAAYDAGDFARAKTELVAARDLAPDKPNPYRWLALAEQRLGDCTGAVAHVEGFLARVPADDARIGELVRLRDQCKRTGTVNVRSRPTGAAIRVDDRDTGLTPATLSLSAGAHVFTLRKPGYTTVVRDLEIHGATTDDAMFALEPETTQPPPAHHRVALWTAIGVGAALVVAGVVYGVTRASDDATTHLPPIACGDAGCR